MTFEITRRGGEIRRMWLEYTWYAFDRLKDVNAKKIVLYLARYGDEERTRKQILDDLGLDLTDHALEQLLHKLIRVDMIGPGRNNFRFQGLGDPIFEMVFRHVYQEEIKEVDLTAIERDIQQELKRVKGELSYRRGLAAELRMINYLLTAMAQGVPMDRLVPHVPYAIATHGRASPSPPGPRSCRYGSPSRPAGRCRPSSPPGSARRHARRCGHRCC